MNPAPASAAAHSRLILSLDEPDLPRALERVRQERERVGAFRVGLGLIHGAGPRAVAALQTVGASQLYYDAQLLDLPSVVAQAGLAVGAWNLWMVTVHTLGGVTMLQAARRALRQSAERRGMRPPLVIGTTLGAHMDAGMVREELGLGSDLESQVVKLAILAQQAGLEGVAVAAPEVARVRAELGPGLIIVAQGIRESDQRAGDQRRTGSAAVAIAAGASYVIVSPSS